MMEGPSYSVVDERLRVVETSNASQGTLLERILDELGGLRRDIQSMKADTHKSLAHLEGRVMRIETLSNHSASKDLAVEVDELKEKLTAHLAKEEVTSKGISWMAAILGGLIASGLTGIAGALASQFVA